MALLRMIGQQQFLGYNSIIAARGVNIFNSVPCFQLYASRQSSYATSVPAHDQQGRRPQACKTALHHPAPADHHPHAAAHAVMQPSPRPLHSSLCKSKRIHLVDCSNGAANAAIYALRLRSPRDFQRMLATSGLLCLVPAKKDAATKAWLFSGDGTRCFSDLRENTFYMAMSALPRSSSSASSSGSPSTSSSESLASLRATVNQVRKELTNRALGEEGELTEALLRIFCKEAGFPNMVSKPQLRIVENEEVDAVLISARAIVIGFHCNKLTHKEAVAALKRVSRWAYLASTGSSAHSFLLRKDLYVVLSGNLLPNKETQRVVSYCQKHCLMLLLKNGINFSLHNSLLPPQHIVPAKLRHEKKQQ